MDARDDQEEIPNHMLRAVNLLLDANPDMINARDKNGATIFHYAVISDAGLDSIIPVVKVLLDLEPLPSILKARDHKGETAFEKAIVSHALRFVSSLGTYLKFLLGNGADGGGCNNKGQNLLHIQAIHFGDTGSADVAILERLIEFVNIDEADFTGRTPLHYMARFLNRINAVRRLISQGANVNAVDNKVNTPLHEVMSGKLVKSRWEKGDFDAMNVTSDRLARAREEMTQILVNAGAAMDRQNAAGKTPTQVLNDLT
ncbi:hypothetical protein N7490_011655 [Penicillium lividum]|nr:hypothetical protein N7490_011655 [Penicillium lividum]